MPLLLALCGSGLVLLAPLYFLVGELGYLGPEWETSGRTTVILYIYNGRPLGEQR